MWLLITLARWSGSKLLDCLKGTCADPENFVRLWLFLWFCDYFSWWWERLKNTIKRGHHRPASKIPLKWCFACGPMMAQHRMLAWFFRGTRPVLLRNPIFLWFFRGFSTPCLPFWIRTWVNQKDFFLKKVISWKICEEQQKCIRNYRACMQSIILSLLYVMMTFDICW